LFRPSSCFLSGGGTREKSKERFERKEEFEKKKKNERGNVWRYHGFPVSLGFLLFSLSCSFRLRFAGFLSVIPVHI
jgi:hypothetical protein